MSSTTSSSRDFSLFSLFTAGLACLVPFADAYTQPVGSSPEGNPISEPGLNSVVPAGKSYTITWQPTTSGTVTLVLLKGPSTNAVPQYAIVEKIENSGVYSWTPSTDLVPGSTGYGIELIDDENGQYQYSTQFGISNLDYSSSSASTSSWASSSWAASSWTSSSWASATSTSAWSSSESVTATSATATANATASSVGVVWVTDVVSSFTTYCPYATSFTMANQTYTVSSATTLTITDCPCTITKPATASATAGPVTGTGSVVASTGGAGNSSIVYPTGSMSVPSSLKTTASANAASSAASATGSSNSSVQTGAATTMATSFAGLVVAAGVAVFAL